MAAYKPPRVETTYERISGHAKVAISPKSGRAQVIFKDNPKKAYVIDAANIQANPVWNGKAFVSISEDGRILFTMRPFSGIFDGRGVGIAAKENEAPTPRTRTGKHGDYQTFTGLVEVISGKYKGCVYGVSLAYKFKEYEGEAGLPGDRGRYPSWDRLEDFTVLCGAWDSPIPWPEDGNVLPEIDQRIRNSDATFKFTVKDGYLDTFITTYEEDDDDDGWGEEEEVAAPKKKKKKK